MRKLARILPPILCLLFVPVCFGQSAGWLNFTASNVQSATSAGGKLPSGILCLQPVDTSNHPLAVTAGGSAGGIVLSTPSCTTVTNGAIVPMQVIDTALSAPANPCLRLTIVNDSGISQIPSTGFSCLQPSSINGAGTAAASWCSTPSGVTTCALDKFPPNIASLAIVQNGPTGAAGAPGPNCSATSPAGTCDLGTTALKTGSVAAGAATLGVITPTSPAAAASSLANFGGQPALTLYGTIYSANSWSSLSAFLANGTTPTISGNALVFSGGNGTPSQSLDYNYDTTLPQWTMATTITIGTISATSYGIGLGIRSYETGGAYLGMVGSIDLSTDASSGSVSIFTTSGSSLSLQTTSPTALPIVAGDVVQLTVTRNGDLFTVTATDLTRGTGPVTTNYEYTFSYPISAETPNRGKFAIFNFGGTQTVTSLQINSSTPVGADVMCVGDSKTAGYYAGTFAQAYCTALQSSFRTVNESGGSDQTGDVLAVIPEIIALKPKAVILNIGRNNICNSVPYASQYASIVSQLQTANITVYHMLPIFETACDQTALTNYINSTYPAANIFDTGLSAYSATPTVVLAEGVHPSPFGETLISSAATAFLWSKGTYSSDQKYGNSVSTPQRLYINGAAPAFPQFYAVNYGLPQTYTTVSRVGNLGQSNDAANPFALAVYVAGSATPSSRTFTLQTVQDGSGSSGQLCLQCFGGAALAPTPTAGDISQNISTTAFVANTVANPPAAGYGSGTPRPVAATTASATISSSAPAFVGTDTAAFLAGSNLGSGSTNPTCYTGDGGQCTATSGLFAVTAGTGPTAGQLAKISWAATPKASRCVFEGSGATAQALSPWPSNQTTTGVYLNVSVAPAASTTYYFYYVCGQ